MKTIMAKLGKMRKAVSWVVYPRKDDDFVLIQSDRRIARFDVRTGVGKLSGSHNYPTFLTLSLPGVEDIVVPPDLIAAAVEAAPKGAILVSSLAKF